MLIGRAVYTRPQAPYLEQDGVTLGRAEVDKRFAGTLEATSRVQMLSARTSVPGSAGYVALERIYGTLDGRQGSFVAVHLGTMGGGREALIITIVPDSGTDELTGIHGSMGIRIEDGQHHYSINWSLPGRPGLNDPWLT